MTTNKGLEGLPEVRRERALDALFPNLPKQGHAMTAAELRAQVEAAKIKAMARFEADWGTRDVAKVMGALRQTIPNSTNPTDAARKARALLG